MMRIPKRERNKREGKGVVKGIFTAAAMCAMLWCMPVISHAEATGKVIPNSVNIRKAPDKNSEVVGSSTIGKEVTIRGKVDASGTTWYQVYIDANTLGYIRADMLDLKEGGDIPTVTVDTSSQEASSQEASSESQPESPAEGASGGAAVGPEESVDAQYATIKVKAKVRPEPSTKKNHIGSLTEGTQVIIRGKSAGSDGKTWYYVTYTASNGSESTGFVREDLLEMGDMLPVEEPPQEEAPQEETPVEEPVANNDYELRLEQDEEGLNWYVYDNLQGGIRHKLQPLLEDAYSRSEQDDEATGAVVKQRIVIVALSVLLVALVVTVVILAFKLRDALYEEYDEDDDDDEDEEEEERPVRRRAGGEEASSGRQRARREDDEETASRRRGERQRGEWDRQRPERERVRGERDTQRGERRTPRERAYEDDSAQERTARTQSRRKAKNFLLDDDEFEFEFLNMDDKNQV